MEFITLGCGNKFDISKFEPIKNDPGFCKPRGGLWSSPVCSDRGWRWFCEGEEFEVDRINSSEFKFRLKEGSKVYMIDSISDLLNIPYKINSRARIYGKLIDFEKMATEYDAIYLTSDGEWTTRYSDYEYGMSLYGWDCECLLVLRPECIEVV